MEVVAVLSDKLESLRSKLEGSGFTLHYCTSKEACLDAITQHNCNLVIVDESQEESTLSEVVSFFKEDDTVADIPVVLMGVEDSLDKRIHCYEIGYDDYLLTGITTEALNQRLKKLIFNKIANDQLKNQLSEARGMVFNVMSNTSDLGVNIQFMLDSHHCENLDELGMLLFQALQHYGVTCSLQMRSQFGIKNMEVNGMAKHLESNLLWELKERGRYVDFGHRSVMNYDKVSLLVKNMPKDNPERYGTLKDNLFSLLQGVDARICAIDNLKLLKLEKELVKLMGERVRLLMSEMDTTYQNMMKEIATVVEDMSERIHDVIVVCGLHEDQEAALEKIIEQAVVETNEVFSTLFMNDSKVKQSMQSIQSSFDGNQPDMTPKEVIRMIKEIKESNNDDNLPSVA